MGNRCPNGHTMSDKALGNPAYEYHYACGTCGHIEMKYAKGGRQIITAGAIQEFTKLTNGLVTATRQEFQRQVNEKAREMVRGMFRPKTKKRRRKR